MPRIITIEGIAMHTDDFETDTHNNESNNQPISRRKFFKKSAVSSVFASTLLSSGVTSDVTASENFHNLIDTNNCQFDALSNNFVYLNNGTEGSMPRCVISELQLSIEKWAADPTNSYESDTVFGKRQDSNRADVAQFFGVHRDNICLTDNTTMGLSFSLLGIDFKANDKVIISNQEHNAILSPLQMMQQRTGIQIITQAFPSVEKLKSMNSAQLIDHLFPNIDRLKNAKALCVSHVYPTTGVRLSLKLLRKKADELNIDYLIVDGAQSLGMLDLAGKNEHISHCDFYAGSGHKWLNGPPGTGLLYIKNKHIQPPEFYPVGSQRMFKYLNTGRNNPSKYPMAKALQVRGSSHTLGFHAMLGALHYVNQSGGFKTIERHILKLSKRVKTFIFENAPKSLISPNLEATLTSGLTVFYAFSWDKPKNIFTDKSTTEKVVAELLKHNVQIRSIGFDNNGQTHYALRVSTGYFNSDADLFTFQYALKNVLEKI